jgi:hypothetical protein
MQRLKPSMNMVSNSKNSKPQLDHHRQNHFPFMVDYGWFEENFRVLQASIAELKQELAEVRASATPPPKPPQQLAERENYTVTELAAETGKCAYTVREWCRLGRVHAEKTDDDEWRIPREELARYRDHGLLPARYLR